MAAGRKPHPTALKLLKGTAQPCRINKDEPKPKTKAKMPAGLSDGAKKCWRQVSRQLSDAGILTGLDAHALSMYCEAYSRWQEANDKIKQYGPVIKAPSGFPVQSPYLAIANKAFDQMKGMLIEFGMTPSSRSKIQKIEEDDKDELSDFLNRKRK